MTLACASLRGEIREGRVETIFGLPAPGRSNRREIDEEISEELRIACRRGRGTRGYW